MPDEGKNFGGSLVLDFRKWWHHVKTIYLPNIFLIIKLCLRPCETQTKLDYGSTLQVSKHSVQQAQFYLFILSQRLK